MSAGPLSIDIFNDPTKVKTFLLHVKLLFYAFIFFLTMARKLY